MLCVFLCRQPLRSHLGICNTVHTHTHTHTHIHTHTHTHVCACSFLPSCNTVQTHTYTHIHTHTCARLFPLAIVRSFFLSLALARFLSLSSSPSLFLSSTYNTEVAHCHHVPTILFVCYTKKNYKFPISVISVEITTISIVVKKLQVPHFCYFC